MVVLEHSSKKTFLCAIADLEKAKNAKVYMPVGTIGKLFMKLESEAFEMTAV